MDPKIIKEWLTIIVLFVGYIFTIAAVWTKLTAKVNGLGGRVKKGEEANSVATGRMDRMEREIADYRRDAQDAVSRLGRVEKAVEGVDETVNQGNLVLGTQLHSIEKLIQEKDSRTRERLVRIETLAQIEKKIGPLPLD